MVKNKLLKKSGLAYSEPELEVLPLKQQAALCESNIDASIEGVSEEDWSLII